MSENKVKWHPIKKIDDCDYDGLPTEMRYYLITVNGDVEVDLFDIDDNFWTRFDDVEAWAYPPVPYKYTEKFETENNVQWHPFPFERPEKEGKYLVTFLTTSCSGDNVIDISTDKYDLLVEQWEKFSGGGWYVIAWAEKPYPYKPQKPIDNHPDAVTARKYMEQQIFEPPERQ